MLNSPTFNALSPCGNFVSTKSVLRSKLGYETGRCITIYSLEGEIIACIQNGIELLSWAPSRSSEPDQASALLLVQKDSASESGDIEVEFCIEYFSFSVDQKLRKQWSFPCSDMEGPIYPLNIEVTWIGRSNSMILLHHLFDRLGDDRCSLSVALLTIDGIIVSSYAFDMHSAFEHFREDKMNDKVNFEVIIPPRSFTCHGTEDHIICVYFYTWETMYALNKGPSGMFFINILSGNMILPKEDLFSLYNAWGYALVYLDLVKENMLIFDHNSLKADPKEHRTTALASIFNFSH